jgi:hypothetical protein
LQAIPDDVDDPADHPQIVNPGNLMGQGKIRLYTVELRFRQVEQIPHGSTSAISESHLILFVNHEIMSPEPKKERIL